MKEAYAVRRTVPPSAQIEARIDELLAVGVGENPRESLSELGARLIIQRAVEDEFDAWLGRARYERRPEYQRGLRNYESGLRNGFRSRRVQTAEGELSVEIQQVREAAETFACKLSARTPKLLRTEPLKALVIGAFVRGLSMRDVESLCEQAGLGKLSKSTASRICEELKDRFAAFKRRSLALFLDATLHLRASQRAEVGVDLELLGAGVDSLAERLEQGRVGELRRQHDAGKQDGFVAHALISSRSTSRMAPDLDGPVRRCLPAPRRRRGRRECGLPVRDGVGGDPASQGRTPTIWCPSRSESVRAAEIESHLDLGSAVRDDTDQDPLAQSLHQVESEAEAGAWNVGGAALALIGDPDGEARSLGRGGDGEGFAARSGRGVRVQDRVRRGFADGEFDFLERFLGGPRLSRDPYDVAARGTDGLGGGRIRQARSWRGGDRAAVPCRIAFDRQLTSRAARGVGDDAVRCSRTHDGGQEGSFPTPRRPG
jgi:Transposase, Mutator family